MEERQVTIDGQTYELPEPVHGRRHPEPGRDGGHLPAARGAARPLHGPGLHRLPQPEAELQMLDVHGGVSPLDDLQPVAHAHEIVKLIDAVRTVHVAEPVRRYAVDLVAATRTHPDLRLGASPRATLHLLRAAKAAAALGGPGLRPAGRRAVARGRGAGAPAAAHRPGPAEPPHGRAGRRGDPAAHPGARRARTQQSGLASGPRARPPTASSRPGGCDDAHGGTAATPPTEDKGGLRAALAGLTTRGRSFLAAGVAAAVCAYVLGQADLLRVGLLLAALPLVCVDRAATAPATGSRAAAGSPPRGCPRAPRPGCTCGWTTSRGCPPGC